MFLIIELSSSKDRIFGNSQTVSFHTLINMVLIDVTLYTKHDFERKHSKFKHGFERCYTLSKNTALKYVQNILNSNFER